ncbi:MAG: hypothetical protein AAF182_00180 [Pseudomonadota bacterium]
MKTTTALKVTALGVFLSLSSSLKAQVSQTALRFSEILNKAKIENNAAINELNTQINPLMEQHEILSAALVTKLQLDSVRSDSITYQQAFNSWFEQAKDKNAYIENNDIPRGNYRQHKEELWSLEDSTKAAFKRLDLVVREIDRLNNLVARGSNGEPLSAEELQGGIYKIETMLAEPLAELEQSFLTAGNIDSASALYTQAVDKLLLISPNIAQIAKLEDQKLAIANKRNLRNGESRSRNELIESDINWLNEKNTELHNEFNLLAQQVSGIAITVNGRNYTGDTLTELDGTESTLAPKESGEDNYLEYILGNDRN